MASSIDGKQASQTVGSASEYVPPPHIKRALRHIADASPAQPKLAGK